MLRTSTSEWGLVTASATLGSSGTSVTPGNNTYGTYVQLIAGASVTDDVYEIWITINSGFVSGQARDTLVKIGTDPAGGTSYTDTILHLAGSCAGVLAASNQGGGGIWYRFPLMIRAGTSIAAAAAVNNATVGTTRCYVKLMSRPTMPSVPRVGTFVRTFGATTASSSGTAIVPGTATKSAYVLIGTTSDPLWFWNFGVCINNASSSSNAAVWDLALGSSTTVNRNIIVDQVVMPGPLETLDYYSFGATAQSAIGDGVYGRAGGPFGSPSGMSVIAYGLGG